MRPSTRKDRGLAFGLALAVAALAGARPAAAQDCSGVAPYVFILFDTSGSMSWAPPCSQAELDAGLCAWRCDSYDCWVPQQADDPSSKHYQIKQALHEVLSATAGVQFGFGSFNQDALGVLAKHWIYEAAAPGVFIPGWGAFPALGGRDVFGALWPCDTGNGNNEIGCAAATPADLPDDWERTRMAELPKLGTNFNQVVNFYVRSGSTVYRVRYTPISPATPGAPVSVTELTVRCNNSACSSTTTIGQTNLSFNPVAEFLAWDNGSSTGLNQTNPQLTYFTPAVADTGAANTCSGWDPNTDTSADAYNGYDLRWPTTADPRGSFFSVGDVIPQDWTTDHRDDILQRLAPNLAANPAASPDFRTSVYLQDRPQGPELFLRLKDASQRPLIVNGSTPLGSSINAFRKWWSGCTAGTCSTGWAAQAQALDPDWACRRQYLIVLSDGDESCVGSDPCAQVSDLYLRYGIKTYPVGFGMPSALGPLSCIAQYGHTQAYTPHLRQELVDTLNSILADIKAGL
jgi:hypothetical protein